MKELKKFRVIGSYVTHYFTDGKINTYRGMPVVARSNFSLTIYRENISHAVLTLFEQHNRCHRFDNEFMCTALDLESLQIIEV